MTTQFMSPDGSYEEDDGWDYMTVYGSFSVPPRNLNVFVLRVPSGRVPWAKKILPKVVALCKRFGMKEKYPFFDGEPTVILPGCFYTNTKDPIPPSTRLWDVKKIRRFEWNGNELVEVL